MHDGAWLGRYLHERLPEATMRRLAIAAIEGDMERVEFERNGLQWITDIGDAIASDLYVFGSYEGPRVTAVLEWTRSQGRRGTLVDVGANIGTTTVPFAQAGYEVIAIEPVPSTFDMLCRNVARNGIDGQVRCVQQAITDSPGWVDMWRGFGSGQSEVAVEGQAPGVDRWGDRGELVTVPSGPLDAIVACTEVALVWADVQGSESSVIATGAPLWAAGVPLHLEVDPHSLGIHGGVARFLDLAIAHFAGFLHDDLTAAPRPIDEIEGLVRSMTTNDYTNALLVH
jgi:FkbM family methyltransferase